MSDEKLILCLRCKEYRPIQKFHIKLPLDPLKDPALVYRPRTTCKVCTARKKHEREIKQLAVQPRMPPEGVTAKQCIACGEEKPLEEFYKLRSGVWGLDPRCKKCKAKGEAARQRRKSREIREAMVEKEYGLSPSAYEAMYQRQGRACAICGMPSPKNPLHVDHNHETGQVRGLLCSVCNTMLGYAREKIAILERAAAYLYAEQHNLNPLNVTAWIEYEMKRYEW